MRRNKRDVRKAIVSGIRRGAEGHESDFHRSARHAETLGFSAVPLGQRKPYPCPTHCPYPNTLEFPLGIPMDIEDVAAILGCSPWTVRQKYLPQGLPHLRASATGRFVFFREQVLDWIVKRQRKEE